MNIRRWFPVPLLVLGLLAAAVTMPGCGGSKGSSPVPPAPGPITTPEFSLALAPAAVSLPQGRTATTAITVALGEETSGTLAMTAAGLPSGVTARFSPESTSTSGSITLTLAAESTATLGKAAITLTGTRGTVTHSVALSLEVVVLPDFTLAALPASITMGPGTAATSKLTVGALSGFKGDVALTASGLPTGVTAAFSPVTGGTSTLTLTASPSTPLGDATVTLTGTSGELSHTATLALKVAAADYALAASTQAISVVQGTDCAVAITVVGVNGFSSPVALTVAGVPAGVTASFSDASTTGTSTLTLVAAASAPETTATIKVTGSGGGFTRTVDFALTVIPPAGERTWTRSGTSFTGTYVKSSGIYNNSVTRHAEIAVSSGPLKGRNRAWPISSFSSEDQTYITARVAAERPADRDPFLGTYQARPHSYNYTAFTAGVNTLETDHFIFWWGTTAWPNAKAYAQYLEDIWTYDRFVLGLTMPYQIVPDNPSDLTDMNRYKINVFVDGTGLPHGQPTVGAGAAAWGSTEICVNLPYANAGDGVIAHEFGHVLQNYSMGSLGWGFGPVGWAWENFAQFHQYQAMPDAPNQMNYWWDTPHWRPEDVTAYCQYSSWVWIIGMNEDGVFPASFSSDIWWNNLRNPVDPKKNEAPETAENIFQTIIRYGGAKGFLDAGNPNPSFGDVMGRFAARSLTMDYLGQETLLATKGTTTFIPTESVPDRSGWFRPTWGMAPYQFGTNVIQLKADPGATSVTVDVQSLADDLDQQDMRSTLVVVDADGIARYSYASTGNIPLRGSGTLTMDIATGETPYLAVASVPLATYRPALQHHGFQAFRPLHYEFKATGASPVEIGGYATPGTRLATHVKNVDGSPAGFIASTATVDDSAYVGADAVVLGTAKIQGHARVEGHALVKGSATVKDDAVVSDYAQVNGGTLSGHARVRDKATVGAATITESAAIYGKASIRNTGTISGKVIIKDDSVVDVSYGAVDGTLTGSTLIAQCADFGVDSAATISQGRFYENCKKDYLDDGAASGLASANIFTAEAKPAENGNYLFANWDFDFPGSNLAMDAWGNSDATLRGTAAPAFSTVTEGGASRAILSLDGVDQYLLLDPRTFDSTDTTLDLMVKFNDTTTEGQRLFDFGTSPSSCLYLTPNEGGKMKLVLVKDGTTLEAAAAVPSPGTWINLRVEMDGTSMRLYQDGTQVASAATPVLPMDLNATRNFLGRSQAGGGFLNAALDHVRVYRTVVANGAFSTAAGQIPGAPPAAQRYYAISHVVPIN